METKPGRQIEIGLRVVYLVDAPEEGNRVQNSMRAMVVRSSAANPTANAMGKESGYCSEARGGWLEQRRRAQYRSTGMLLRLSRVTQLAGCVLVQRQRAELGNCQERPKRLECCSHDELR